MKILIQNGRVIDPASGFDQTCDIALAAGRIMAIGRTVADFVPHRTIDASGCIVMPGLVDPTPTPCSTSPAWSRCSSFALKSCTRRGCFRWVH